MKHLSMRKNSMH